MFFCGFALTIIYLLSSLTQAQNDSNLQWFFVQIPYQGVTVYKAYYTDSDSAHNITGYSNWLDYCSFPDFCMGLYCNINEVLNDNNECVPSSNIQGFMYPKIMLSARMANESAVSYLYFDATYDPPLDTDIGRYSGELHSTKASLLVRSILKQSLFKEMVDYSTYIFNSENTAYNHMTAKFLALRNETATDTFSFVSVDYKCSLQYNLGHLIKIYMSGVKLASITRYFYITSLIISTIILCIYLTFKQLRSTLNGKCVIIYFTLEIFLRAVVLFVFYTYLKENPWMAYINNVAFLSVFHWLCLLCYDTYKIVRYHYDFQNIC
jgi:hypothetical protein